VVGAGFVLARIFSFRKTKFGFADSESGRAEDVVINLVANLGREEQETRSLRAAVSCHLLDLIVVMMWKCCG
jgi:hypothetical protein